MIQKALLKLDTFLFLGNWQTNLKVYLLVLPGARVSTRCET